MQIVAGDLSDSRVIDLVHTHLISARAETGLGSAHALDLTELQAPNVSVWTIWNKGVLLGIGALKLLSPDHGEVKSMHIVQSMRKQGIGSALLLHIISVARARGMSRLSLETGSWQYFHPAREFYKHYGFQECPAFGDYIPDPNSVFMSLDLMVNSADLP